LRCNDGFLWHRRAARVDADFEDANFAGGFTCKIRGSSRRRLLPVKNFILALSLPVVAVAAYAASYYFHAAGGTSPAVAADVGEADPPPEPSPGSVTALGRLEPAAGVLTVAGPMGDRLEKLSVKANQDVTEGQELGLLASYDLRKQKVAIAESQKLEAMDLRQTNIDQAKLKQEAAEIAAKQVDRFDLQIQVQQEKIKLLEEALKFEEGKQQSLSKLSPRLVSQQEITGQKLLVNKAKGEVLAAQKQLEGLEQEKLFARQTATQQLAAANKAVALANKPLPASLDAAIELTKKELALSVLKAPVAGRVLHLYTREGEPTGAKPILQMASVEQMICKAEVHQDDVKWLKPGQSVTLKSRALPAGVKALTGKVLSVGEYISPPDFENIDPRFRRPGEVVVVKIALDGEGADSSNAVARGLVNLELEVAIDVAGP